MPTSLSEDAATGALEPIAGRTYTGEEVAVMFHAAPSTVRHWRAVRTGPKCFKAGKRFLYRGEDLLAWQAAGGTRQPKAG